MNAENARQHAQPAEEKRQQRGFGEKHLADKAFARANRPHHADFGGAFDGGHAEGVHNDNNGDEENQQHEHVQRALRHGGELRDFSGRLLPRENFDLRSGGVNRGLQPLLPVFDGNAGFEFHGDQIERAFVQIHGRFLARRFLLHGFQIIRGGGRFAFHNHVAARKQVIFAFRR